MEKLGDFPFHGRGTCVLFQQQRAIRTAASSSGFRRQMWVWIWIYQVTWNQKHFSLHTWSPRPYPKLTMLLVLPRYAISSSVVDELLAMLMSISHWSFISNSLCIVYFQKWDASSAGFTFLPLKVLKGTWADPAMTHFWLLDLNPVPWKMSARRARASDH